MRENKKTKRTYINIKTSVGTIHTVLVVGYTPRDCGFFMSNVKNDEGKHLVFEHWMPLKQFNEVGIHWTKSKNKFYITSYIPKLTHHRDGRAHVSGGKIVSGFYKFFKKGKGIYTKSYDLLEVNNDGGPTMGATIWGLDHFSNKEKNNTILFDESTIFEDFIGKREGSPDCYVIEAYYVPKIIDRNRYYITNVPARFHMSYPGIITGYDAPKNVTIENFLTGKPIPLFHPVYGDIKGMVVTNPKDSPGYLILTCNISSVGDGFREHAYGHQISGAPSFVTWKGVKNIFIQYPHTVFPHKFYTKAKSLDLNRVTILKSKIDDFLYRFFCKKRK